MSMSPPSPLQDGTASAAARHDGGDEPADYGDAAAEYRAALEHAALFRLPRATKIELRGADRARFLHGLCTNDVKGLPAGRACEAFITTVQAKILAAVRIAATTQSLTVDTVPGMAAVLLAHLDRYLITEKVELGDRTADFADLVVAGPAAFGVLSGLAADLPELGDAALADPVDVAGGPCRVLRWDALGVPTYELRVSALAAEEVWKTMRDAGRAAGLRPAGRTARDTLRVEAGTPEYGVDIDATNFPQEIGRDERAISYTTGCYLGQETVARIHALGHVNRLLVGIAMPGLREAPPRGSALSSDGKTIGRLTSAVFSPALGCVVGLGYVARGREKPGTAVAVATPDGPVSATVRSLPLR